MEQTRHPGHFDARFVRHLASLTRIYWTSPDAKRGAPLLLLCVAMELGLVYANVRLAGANGAVFNAIQGKAWPRFVDAIEHFLLVALIVVLISTYRIYFRNILQIRWRENLTAYFIDSWIGPYAYGHSQLHHEQTDNPDQRISEDIQSYVASALGLSLSLLSAVATLASFSGVLWKLSGSWPLRIGDHEYWIPGLMMWVAILYSIVSMFFTHRVGRTLVGINFDRLRFEADFRYGLVRFRDHTEAVALARGQAIERGLAMQRFHAVIANWWDLITKQRNLTVLTGGIGQANGIVPLLVAAPAFFTDRMTLGGVTETGIAYGQVSGALSWFVDAYQEIAAWRASIERLSTFRETLDETRAVVGRPDAVHVVDGRDAAIRLVALDLERPEGEPIAKGLAGDLPQGDRLAILGPPGAVKTTLFRAIAGIWPFGHGRIEIPGNARALFLARQPYLPICSLRAAISYPAETDAFGDDAIREALAVVGLDGLAARLDASDAWDQQLSGDEQQRLMFVRALLHAPDWLVMDDATAALDEATERRIYDVVASRLPTTTVVSLTNRPSVAQIHRRRFALEVGADDTARLRRE
ncbi:MAG TPA: ABC transporter ATP-binding protein/permease [Candidatus Binatia bacterium]|nr:ABC transporter ATP-binding protein/permease [Candidatus Binatia bacterium]